MFGTMSVNDTENAKHLATSFSALLLIKMPEVMLIQDKTVKD
jgi:hypothetical protein